MELKCESDARKLQQRSEQAAKLSTQLQVNFEQMCLFFFSAKSRSRGFVIVGFVTVKQPTLKHLCLLQEIARQNDTLTVEVERLSTALSSATTFIEETTEKYANMRDQLLESNKIIEKLSLENESLSKQVGRHRERTYEFTVQCTVQTNALQCDKEFPQIAEEE